MAETMQTLLTRRSCRSYKPDMPDRKTLETILQAGTYAPTGMGRQSPVILAVTNKALRDRLSQLNAQVMGRDTDPFYGAPVVLVVLYNRAVSTGIYDGSLVMGNLLNAAADQGLAGCWIHRAKEVFNTEEGKAILRQYGIEGDWEGVGNCILGYPAAAPSSPAPRKSDYVHWAE